MSDSVARASSLLSIVALVACGSAGGRPGPAAAEPPSCRGTGNGISECGPTRESCCASPEVPGGEYYRSFDGVSTIYTSQAFPATVSGFRLDKNEITVGRFRQFVSAVVGGWRPPAGSGAHEHLHGGSGLADSTTPGRYETGWDRAWDASLATRETEWTNNLQCFAATQTWTPVAGANEGLPITCVDWYEAYAFCIWDGGFLPSEAEWNYAATGGSEQRVYPWSVPPSSMSIDCQHANLVDLNPCVGPPPNGIPNRVGSESPAGDGKWGQADLAGNAWEWTLDFYADYAPASADGANLDTNEFRVIRGGAFDYHSTNLLASFRYDSPRSPATETREPGARARHDSKLRAASPRTSTSRCPIGRWPFGRCGRIRSWGTRRAGSPACSPGTRRRGWGAPSSPCRLS